MKALIVLHLPDANLKAGRILATTRDPRVFRLFRKVVIEAAQADIAAAEDDANRQIAEARLVYLQTVFAAAES